ncbi:ankyrin [Wilcoxina mikolae CBS 423.85]|nr:ankyrin [Wilcoxina mikolae CBS 423.85]
MLLDNGAELEVHDYNGFTALFDATFANNPDMVALLLDKGADLNARCKLQRTALHVSAERDGVEVIRILLERGADINAKDIHDITPLMLAGSDRAGAILMEYGADTRGSSYEGRVWEGRIVFPLYRRQVFELDVHPLW